MTDQQKIIIDEELKKIGAKLDNYDDFIEYKKDLRIDKSTISKAKKITRLNFESILYQYKQIQQIKY